MQKTLTFDSTYDFSRFDTSIKNEVKTKKKVKVVEETNTSAKSVVSGFAFVSWIICMALVFGIVYSYMVLTETADQASVLQNELETMREETQMLEIKKEQMYGSQRLQEIAVEQLGMQKIQKSQITYVDTNGGDYTEVAGARTMKDESPILAGIARGFNTFIEYIN